MRLALAVLRPLAVRDQRGERTLTPQPELPQPEPPVPASKPAGNGRPRAKERAEAFVREQLANGPAPGECVKAAAAEAEDSAIRLLQRRLAVGDWPRSRLEDEARAAGIAVEAPAAAASRLGVVTLEGRWALR